MEEFRKSVAKRIASHTGLQIHEIEALLESPKEAAHGDISFPCFSLSKVQKKSPALIAKELASHIEPTTPLKKVEALGPYVNFFLEESVVASPFFAEVKKEAFGVQQHIKKENVMLEFCQANTHKPFHIGHFRNISLGDSLVRIWKFLGHEVISANYQGDTGAHVAKCLWALDKFHKDEIPPESNRGEWLGKIYSEANSRVEESLDYKKEVSEVLQKLEGGVQALNALLNK